MNEAKTSIGVLAGFFLGVALLEYSWMAWGLVTIVCGGAVFLVEGL